MRNRRTYIRQLSILWLILRGFCLAGGVSAVEVTTPVDEDDGNLDPATGAGVSLREAVNHSASGSVITFDPAVFDGEAADTITFATGQGQLLVDRELTIDASGASSAVTVDAGGAGADRRVIRVTFTGSLTIDSLVITGGDMSGSGGGIANQGKLRIRRSVLTGNSATRDGGAIYNGDGGDIELTDSALIGNHSTGDDGGAIFTQGAGSTLILERCTLNANSAFDKGGGILSVFGASVTLINSTVTANSANAQGGGLWVGTTAGLTVRSCTVVGNHCDNLDGLVGGGFGGGILGLNGGALAVENSIVAMNTASSRGPDIDGFVSLHGGVNVLGDASGSAGLGGEGADYLLIPDPMLLPLQNYGGTTETMPPHIDSPVIDAGGTTVLVTDQRSLPRILDGDGSGSAALDIGASEFDPTPVTALVVNTDDGGDGSLRETLAGVPPGSTIIFSPELSGGSIILSGGPLLVGRDVTIDVSALPDGIVLGGGQATRVLEISAGVSANLVAVTVTGGAAAGPAYPDGRGGGILNRGQLILSRSALFGNSASVAGGGLYNDGGTLTVRNSTLTGNHSGDDGGGIYNSASGTLILDNATVAENSAMSDGGGLFNDGGQLSLHNAIVAENTAPNFGVDIRNDTIATTSGGSLVGNPAFSGLDLGSTVMAGDPQLAPLGDYGGPSPTMLLLPDSPAIDAGGASSSSADQRGGSRLLDGDGLAGAQVDAGAVEYDPAPVTAMVLNTADTGFGSLRNTLAWVPPGSTIDFAANLDGRTIQLGNGANVPDGSQLVIAKDLGIDATRLSYGITINSNSTSRIFEVGAGSSVNMAGLTISGGRATGALSPGDRGGGILNFGDLDLEGCSVTGNSAITGGGIYSSGFLILRGSEFLDNDSGSGGGVFIEDRSRSSIFDCQFSGNTANGASSSVGQGGGAFVGSLTVVTVADSTFSLNRSTSRGGGLFVSQGSMIGIEGTTLSDNQGGGSGGAIANRGGELFLTNSTLARNSAGSGGGIYNDWSPRFIQGTMSIHSSTIVENTATINRAGGILADGGIVLHNSIIAGNISVGTNPDLESEVELEGVNLVGDLSDTDLVPGENLIVGDPRLAPLGDFGGSTHTAPPLPGSPVIEGAVLLEDTPLTDQLGNPRPSGAHPDIGAVEAIPFSGFPLVDSDHDGIDDRIEPAYGHLAVGIDDSAFDTDGDGSSDADEIGNMTDLLDADDYLRIRKIGLSPAFDARTSPEILLTFDTFPGQRYQLESSGQLRGFEVIPGSEFIASGFSETVSTVLGPQRDYVRVSAVSAVPQAWE